MKSIGNVFDATRPDPAASRGPDLAAAVEVPRERLGRSCTVHIPERLDLDGVPVERARSPHDDHPTAVTLHLPEGLPEGAVLRLRGQGGVLEGGVPGDLYVRITVVDREPTDEERGGDDDDYGASAPDHSSAPAREGEQRGSAGMLLIAIGLVLALILLALIFGQR